MWLLNAHLLENHFQTQLLAHFISSLLSFASKMPLSLLFALKFPIKSKRCLISFPTAGTSHYLPAHFVTLSFEFYRVIKHIYHFLVCFSVCFAFIVPLFFLRLFIADFWPKTPLFTKSFLEKEWGLHCTECWSQTYKYGWELADNKKWNIFANCMQSRCLWEKVFWKK